MPAISLGIMWSGQRICSHTSFLIRSPTTEEKSGNFPTAVGPRYQVPICPSLLDGPFHLSVWGCVLYFTSSGSRGIWVGSCSFLWSRWGLLEMFFVAHQFVAYPQCCCLLGFSGFVCFQNVSVLNPRKNTQMHPSLYVFWAILIPCEKRRRQQR